MFVPFSYSSYAVKAPSQHPSCPVVSVDVRTTSPRLTKRTLVLTFLSSLAYFVQRSE